jgi:hypothetical protein
MTTNKKLTIAILAVLVMIAILLICLLIGKFANPNLQTTTTTTPTQSSSTTTTTTKTTTSTSTSTSTTTSTTTSSTTNGSVNQDPPEDEGGVYDIFLYDVDPDNDGYRILGLDPEYLSWQSPPDELIIPETINGVQVTAIGTGAFKGVQSTTIVLPNGLIDIYKEAFYNCGAKNINIPSTVRYIGSAAFQKCHFLLSITVPEGVDIIRDNTFRECTYIESISLPSTLEYVGNYAFAQCQTLTSITIPSDCNVEDTAFNYSPNLEVEYK